MSEPVRKLIEELIETARARGMTQAELASRSGISAVGLSKARQRGDIRASTLARMAEVLDRELTLVPARHRQRAVEAIRAGRFFRRGGDGD